MNRTASGPASVAPFPFAIVGFDLDGTLFDTHRDLAQALNHALATAGRAPIADRAARGLIGGGTSVMLEQALEITGGPVGAVEFARLRTALVDHYAAHIADHTRPFAGAEAALDALADAGVAVALVTNKPESLATRLIETLAMRHRFFTVIGGDTLGPGRAKPAPDLLHEMVRRARLLGVAGRAAYVGDSTFDVRAARAAGLPCVAVSFGFSDVPAGLLGADAVIGRFAALLPALARL